MNNDTEKTKDLYAEEARERWGDTDAYKECGERTADFTQDDWNKLSDDMDAIIEGFAKLNERGVAPDHEKPRLQVRKLRQLISDRMYSCTDDILKGLGEMYVADERFKKNIDKHGEGTAEYINECIKTACL